MTIHRFANQFEMVTPREPRYSLGLSVLIVIAMALAGWAAIGFAAYKFL